MDHPVSTSEFLLNDARKWAVACLVVLALFGPPLCLFMFWVGGERLLMLTALVLPVLSCAIVLVPQMFMAPRNTGSELSQLAFETSAAKFLASARENGTKTAVFLLEIDEFSAMRDHYGQAAMDKINDQMVSRLRSAMRPNDALGRIGEHGFGVCLTPQPKADLEICLEIAGRLTRALSEPYAIDGTVIYMTVSIGFCQLGRETAVHGEDGREPVLACAREALNAATGAAPGAIRSYAHKPRNSATAGASPHVQPSRDGDPEKHLDPVEALENGDIVPWFQPQISTDTGKVTGFEALARWIHPELGVIPPAKFLPKLNAAHKLGRLSEVMLYHGLTALRAWDQADADIQHLSINFSEADLNDPKLVDKVSWELDRFEIEPSRLIVEILENVMSQGPDDVISRNTAALSALGCQIDLDDFGTGNASLNAIKRFRVNRIKIDRSFIMKCDRDPEQQRMIRAILTLAEKLQLETVAEGVETVGEHSLLAQLGCSHVQGFGISRPLPFEKTLDWISGHNAKLEVPPNFGNQTR